LENSWPGCRIDTSAFVEKVSGGRLAPLPASHSVER
jgi:hypothetical protein